MKKYLIYLATGLLGAGGGYFYWARFGCTNGCPLTSSAPLMTIYGALVALTLVSLIASRKRKPQEPA
jgi:uncharacterized membrane protein YeaQ/YmgE (transglycosylase-associated protein family)